MLTTLIPDLAARERSYVLVAEEFDLSPESPGKQRPEGNSR